MRPHRSGGDDEVVQDMKAMNAPAEVIEAFLQQEKPEDEHCKVLPENWDAVNLFNQMGTQWRSSLVAVKGGFMSVRTGLDYTALEALMRMMGTHHKSDVLTRIQIMESAALEEMNK